MSTPMLPPSLEAAPIPGLPDAAYYISDFITEEEETVLLEKILSRPASTWRTLSRRRLQVYPSPLSPKGEMAAGALPDWLQHPVIPRLLSIPLKSSSTPTASTARPDQPSPHAPSSIPTAVVSNSQSQLAVAHLFSGSPHARPNHVLVNEYPPGTGIMPHEDGPAYHPVVATVSLGSHGVLDIYPKPDPSSPSPSIQSVDAAKTPPWRILQERRSLLISTGAVYEGCLHGIRDVDGDEDLDEEGVVNWGLLRAETRMACEEGTGYLQRGTRVSLTIRDVKAVRDWGRLVPGLGGRR